MTDLEKLEARIKVLEEVIEAHHGWILEADAYLEANDRDVVFTPAPTMLETDKLQ